MGCTFWSDLDLNQLMDSNFYRSQPGDSIRGKPSNLNLRILALFLFVLAIWQIAPICLAAENKYLLEMERFERDNSIANSDSRSTRSFSSALIGPPIRTSDSLTGVEDRYEIVSTTGVVHSFKLDGTEVRSEEVRLDQSVGNPLYRINSGPYQGAGLVTTDSGSIYIVRKGKIEATLPSRLPPKGLPIGVYTTAAQLDDKTFVMGSNRNEVIFVDIEVMRVTVKQLGHSKNKIHSQPLVIDDAVFLTSDDGHVYKVIKNHAVRSIDLREAVSAPAIQIGREEFIVGTENGNLMSFNKDLSKGRYGREFFGGSINKYSLRKYGEFLWVSSWDDRTGAKTGVINLITSSGGKFHPLSDISYGAYLYRKNGQNLFLMVDNKGRGYIRDSKMAERATFCIGDEPKGAPFRLGRQVVVPTVSGTLAVVHLRSDIPKSINQE